MLFGLLARFSPQVVFAIGLALGAIPAGAGGWALRGWVFDTIERPQIVETQLELCTARVEKAAADARAAEQLRQFRAGERATQQFIEESQRAEDARRAADGTRRREIAEYVRHLEETGRLCGLDGDDLEFLGVQPEPGGDAAGGDGAG